MALRKLLRGKLHAATVTHADVAYEGSVSIPPELMEAFGVVAYEAVSIWDVTNGARLETYVITGQPGSRDISINGAAAHLIRPGDKVIIACFGMFEENEVASHKPNVVFLDSKNQIKAKRAEVAGPQLIDVP